MTEFMRDELGAPKGSRSEHFHAELDVVQVREKAHTREGLKPPGFGSRPI